MQWLNVTIDRSNFNLIASMNDTAYICAERAIDYPCTFLQRNGLIKKIKKTKIAKKSRFVDWCFQHPSCFVKKNRLLSGVPCQQKDFGCMDFEKNKWTTKIELMQKEEMFPYSTGQNTVSFLNSTELFTH